MGIISIYLGEKKKYVWFRWPDPTYFFRPTLNFFSHLNTKKMVLFLLNIQENCKERF